jgi:hypothetical protein
MRWMPTGKGCGPARRSARPRGLPPRPWPGGWCWSAPLPARSRWRPDRSPGEQAAGTSGLAVAQACGNGHRRRYLDVEHKACAPLGCGHRAHKRSNLVLGGQMAVCLNRVSTNCGSPVPQVDKILAGSFRTQTVDQGNALDPACACPTPPERHADQRHSVNRDSGCGTDQRFPCSGHMWSPPQESNRRPHPNHGTTRNRCADRRSRTSRPTGRAEVIGSPSAKVCVHFRADAEISGSSHPLNSRPRYPLCQQRGRGAAGRQGRSRAATPRSRPAPPPRDRARLAA